MCGCGGGCSMVFQSPVAEKSEVPQMDMEDARPKTSDLLVGKTIPIQTYIPSDSDSDIDENGTPPTIIKRKSEVPR
jgi:hypothetical protein